MTTAQVLDYYNKTGNRFHGLSVASEIGDSPTIVNPSFEVGYDVFLLAGQSNCEGFATPIDLNFDYTNPNILQYGGGNSSTLDKTLTLAVEPLRGRSGGVSNAIGFGLTFAKLYHQYTGKKVILIPTALGGTGFANNRWNSTGGANGAGRDLYEFAIQQVREVLNISINNKLIAILWHQGELDADNNTANYATMLDAMIAGFRTRLNLPNLPFILGEMVESWVAANSSVRGNVQNLIRNTPLRVTNTRTVTSSGLLPLPDGIHFNAVSQRELGRRYFEALYGNWLDLNLPTPVRSLTGIAAANSVTLSWVSEPTTEWLVEYRETSQPNQPLTVINSRSRNLTISSLLTNTSYTFNVKSSNRNGISDPLPLVISTLSSESVPTPLIQFDGALTNSGSNSTATVTNTNVTVVSDATRGNVLQFASIANTTNWLRVGQAVSANFTKAAWVRAVSTWTNYQTIMSSGGDVTGTSMHTFFYRNNKIAAGYLNGSFYNVEDPTNFDINTWAHYATTRNGDVTKLFRNGVLVATGNGGGFTGSVDLVIGSFGTATTSDSWKGQMDKIQFWNEALTDSQIAALFAQG